MAVAVEELRQPVVLGESTAKKVARQPNPCPSQVPNGTPRIFATVRPVNMMAMAEAFLSGATSVVATTEPTPKKVPCAKAVSTRAAIRLQ